MFSTIDISERTVAHGVFCRCRRTILRFIDLGGDPRPVTIHTPLLSISNIVETDAVERDQKPIESEDAPTFKIAVRPQSNSDISFDSEVNVIALLVRHPGIGESLAAPHAPEIRGDDRQDLVRAIMPDGRPRFGMRRQTDRPVRSRADLCQSAVRSFAQSSVQWR